MTYSHSKHHKHNGCNNAAHDHSDAGRLIAVMVAVVTEADFKIVMNGDIDRPSLVQEKRPVVLQKSRKEVRRKQLKKQNNHSIQG